MITAKENMNKINVPGIKIAESWRDCVLVVDTPDGSIQMVFVKKTLEGVSFCADHFPVEYNMTEEEVGKKILSMFEEFPEFEKNPYPEDYSKYPHCKSNEVWDCIQAKRASFHLANITRRGCGNIILDNRIIIYVGNRITGDAGIAVAHNNGMYGIATIPRWKDYGVILK